MSSSTGSSPPSIATGCGSRSAPSPRARSGYDTPGGVFTILEKDIDHRSRTYDNAPMPYQQRLTWKGVAMHAGNLPGYPASHGCIRLPLEFSKLLFKTTTMGGTVVIANSKADPLQAPAGRGARAAYRRRQVDRAAAVAQQPGLSLEPRGRADRAGVDHHLDRRPIGGGASQRRRDRPRQGGGRPAGDRIRRC